MFCFMMSQVEDKSIGASHYTMLASLEVAGKSVPALFSGVIAERYGLRSLFLLGAVLSSLYTASILVVLITAKRKERGGDEKQKRS
jgi:PAT family beta-lactamase induction signal transducer AmpG